MTIWDWLFVSYTLFSTFLLIGFITEAMVQSIGPSGSVPLWLRLLGFPALLLFLILITLAAHATLLVIMVFDRQAYKALPKPTWHRPETELLFPAIREWLTGKVK